MDIDVTNDEGGKVWNGEEGCKSMSLVNEGKWSMAAEGTEYLVY